METVVFMPSFTSTTVNFVILGDSTNELTESFTAQLTADPDELSLGTPFMATVTITDDDGKQLCS